MELRLLGPLEVRHDGTPVMLRAAKPRQLLSLLAIRANRPVTPAELVDELWEGAPPPSAATALRVHVGRLRQLLDLGRSAGSPSTRLPAGPNGYVLRVEPDELDIQRFERQIVLAREANGIGDAPTAVPLLTAALDLWRGPALGDVRHLVAAAAEVARLDELRAIAVEELAGARLVLGEHALVVDLLSAALEDYPLRERLTADLMVALYRCGRQADALAAYSALAARLDRELGVPPSAKLRHLEEDVLLQRPSLDFTATVPAPVSATTRPRVRRFIGRRLEIAQLVDSHDAVLAGARRLVLVTGSAGIGKTTLVEEFAARVARRGTQLFAGACDEGSLGGYRPVVEALRSLLSRATPEELAALPAELAVVVPDLVDGGVAAAGDESARYLLFEAIAHTLARGGGQPLVLLLEDLHWADRPTLLLLRYLLHHRELPQLMVIATYRDDDVGAERAELIDQLAPRAIRVEVPLAGFSDHEVRALIRTTAPPESMQALVDRTFALQELTAGNPLFLRELLRDLDAEPVKFGDSDEFAAMLATIAPSGVRALVERRLRRVSAAALEVVQSAAVVGTDISLAGLVATTERPADEVFGAVEEVLGSRLLVEDVELFDALHFPHAIVRNAVYAAIPDDERRELHWRYAEYLDTNVASAPRVLVAHHRCAAVPFGARDRAARAAEQAGGEATRRFAWAEAAHWFERALELDDATTSSHLDRARLLLALGRAYERDQQLARARTAYFDGAAAARAAGDYALLADLALASAGPWSSGSHEQGVALALLEDALPYLDRRDPRRVEVLNGIASALYYTDARREGMVAFEAEALADELGDPVAGAIARLAVHRWYTHDARSLDARLALAREALDLVAADHRTGELHLRIQREVLADLLQAADIDGFARCLSDYEQTAARAGSPRDIYWAVALRATEATLHGQLDAAEQLARGAALRGHELEQHAAGAHMLHRFVLRYQQNRLGEELAVLRGAASVPTVFRSGAALAAVAFAETGHGDQARATAAAALGEGGDELPHDVFWLGAVALLASVATVTQDRSLGELLTAMLSDCSEQLVVFGTGGAVLGSVRHWLGTLAALRGDTPGAIEHLEAAIEIATRIDAPFWRAQAQLDLARALAATGDTRGARRLQSLATTTATDRGYGRILRLAAR